MRQIVHIYVINDEIGIFSGRFVPHNVFPYFKKIDSSNWKYTYNVLTKYQKSLTILQNPLRLNKIIVEASHPSLKA